jgi:formylglycine-generating enzyme required for sulfatase activity
VLRGGDWNYFADFCRSAYRFYYFPTEEDFNFGFRSVLPSGQ